MSTFIVRVHRVGPTAIRGEARHVRTGASTRFTSEKQLLAFFEEMNASCLPATVAGPPEPTPRDGSRRRRPART